MYWKVVDCGTKFHQKSKSAHIGDFYTVVEIMFSESFQKNILGNVSRLNPEELNFFILLIIVLFSGLTTTPLIGQPNLIGSAQPNNIFIGQQTYVTAAPLPNLSRPVVNSKDLLGEVSLGLNSLNIQSTTGFGVISNAPSSLAQTGNLLDGFDSGLYTICNLINFVMSGIYYLQIFIPRCEVHLDCRKIVICQCLS